MAKRVARLSKNDVKLIQDKLAVICHRGTPEAGYLDSGFWEFLKYVRTKDEHDPASPVKMFPVKEYNIWAFTHMLACEKLLIPKSRQIMVSWMLAAYACWFVRTQPHCLVIVQSKKAEDANDLVSMGKDNPCAGRVDFIEQHLPSWLRDPFIASGQGNKVGQMIYSPRERSEEGVRIPWYGSRIMAVPQGADQVRGKTVSLFVSDESAFQEEFKNAVIALLPALMSPTSSTRFISASSVNGGSEFNRMVLESYEGLADGDLFVEPSDTGIDETRGIVAASPTGALPDGMRSWETPSGFGVLEIHYRSDPDKNSATERGAAWLKRAAKAYPDGGMKSPGWQQEMEIDYSALGGLPVFPFLMDPESPALVPEMKMREVKSRRMSVYAGYDYGTTNPSAFIVWGQDPATKDWYALWELYEPCRAYRAHVSRVKACPYLATSQVKYVRCDHSLGSKNQQHESGLKSVVDLFAKEGLTMIPGRKGAGETLRLMMLDWWSDIDEWAKWDAEERTRLADGLEPRKRKPRCYITSGCPKLWWELQRLRYQEHSSAKTAAKRNALEKIMDKDDHAFQASAYVLDTRPEADVARLRLGRGNTWNEAEERLRRADREQRYEGEWVA